MCQLCSNIVNDPSGNHCLLKILNRDIEGTLCTCNNLFQAQQSCESFSLFTESTRPTIYFRDDLELSLDDRLCIKAALKEVSEIHLYHPVEEQDRVIVPSSLTLQFSDVEPPKMFRVLKKFSSVIKAPVIVTFPVAGGVEQVDIDIIEDTDLFISKDLSNKMKYLFHISGKQEILPMLTESPGVESPKLPMTTH